VITIPQTNVAGFEISSHKLTHVDREASVLDASKLMRKTGATELLVTGVANGTLCPLGLLTANDIVTRVIAAGLDPAVLTTGDIAWCGIASPDTSGSHTEKRRLHGNYGEAMAVMDGDGRLVGTVRLDEFIATSSHQPAAD
jgi:CBS domain-containing protein